MTAFFIPLFFILHSLSFPTVVRADGPCGGFGYWNGTCCDYGDTVVSNPFHIKDPDPLCTEEPRRCSKQYFDLNPGGLNYGPCLYCNPNVAKHGDPCHYTCNWSCAPDDDDGDGEECPVPDYETDPCCPLEANLPSSLPEWVINILETLFENWMDAIFNLKATVEFKDDELQHAHVEDLTQRYFGTPVEDFDDGVMKKLMPPNYIFIQEEAERERVYNEWGRWKISAEPEIAGEEDTGGEIEGADPHLYEADYAFDFIDAALTKIPGEEEEASLPLAGGDEDLCHPVLISADNVLTKALDPEEVSGKVLAVTGEGLCHEILPGDKHGACVSEEGEPKIDISLTDAIKNILGGKIKVYPRFSFLRDIFFHTAGPRGAFRIFDLPGETHDEYDGETEGDLEVRISLSHPLLPDWGWNFSVEEEAQVWETGTEKAVDDEIKQKLSVPQAENAAAGYQAPESHTVRLASNPAIQGAQYAPTTSFAERIGRTLGEWLGKLITL